MGGKNGEGGNNRKLVKVGVAVLRILKTRKFEPGLHVNLEPFGLAVIEYKQFWSESVFCKIYVLESSLPCNTSFECCNCNTRHICERKVGEDNKRLSIHKFTKRSSNKH